MVSWLNTELLFENVCKGVSKCAYPALHTAMGFEMTTPLPFFDHGERDQRVSEREQKSRVKTVFCFVFFKSWQSLAVKERSCFVLC